TERGRADEAYAFSVGFELRCEQGLVPRPDLAGASARDWDDMVAALQYRHHREYAVGHGVSVEVVDKTSPPTRVRTTWLPCASVPRVKPNEVSGVESGMKELSVLDGPEAVKGALGALVEAYDDWID